MIPGPTPSAPGYETRDARISLVAAGAGLLMLLIAVSLVLAAFVERGRNAPAMVGADQRSFRHGPDEESGIAREWRVQEAAERRHLDGYAWLDRDAGVVQIPIERAIDLMVNNAAARPEISR